MKKMMLRLWRDDAGFVVSSELVLIATVLVIGMLVGLTTIRDSVVQELADVGIAIGQVDQSYSFGMVTGHCASTAGGVFVDLNDFCEEANSGNQNAGAEPGCLSICVGDNGEGI